MAQDGLFTNERQRERLLALGWKRLERYGRVYWEHPESRAWYAEAEAAAMLPPENPERPQP